MFGVISWVEKVIRPTLALGLHFDKGLTLEMLAFESPYDGQISLSTQPYQP